MTKKVGQLLGMTQPDYTFQPGKVRHTCGFGVEVEAENVTTFGALETQWRIVGDGSLRNNGYEFICPGPQAGTKLDEMLELLEQEAVAHNYTFGPRTSVHVHVDVRDITSPALFRFILLYAVFERVLYSRFAGDRYSNNFCVPLAMDGDLVRTLSDMDRARVIRSLSRSRGEALRYRGLNIESLFNLGTLEFRFCAGTPSAETIRLLVNALGDMRQYAVTHTSIARYVDFASEGDLSNLFFRVFGDAATLSQGLDVYSLTKDGARVVEQILYAKDLSLLQDEVLKEHALVPEEAHG